MEHSIFVKKYLKMMLSLLLLLVMVTVLCSCILSNQFFGSRFSAHSRKATVVHACDAVVAGRLG